MPATKINPFQLWEPLGKLFLDMYQGALEDICPTLAMTMTMETFYIVGQLIGQLIGCNAKTTSGSTWIIKQRTHFGISRIDTQTTIDLRIYLPHPLMITGILRQGIERKMAGASGYLVDLVVGISWRIGMSLAAELLESQPRLTQRAGCSGMNILTEYRKSFP